MSSQGGLALAEPALRRRPGSITAAGAARAAGRAASAASGALRWSSLTPDTTFRRWGAAPAPRIEESANGTWQDSLAVRDFG